MSRIARGSITLHDVADGLPGAPGSPGSPGDTGDAGARSTIIYLYRETADDTVPSAPGATITWATGDISSISAGWSTEPPTVDASGTNRPWVSTVTFFQSSSSSQASVTVGTGSTPKKGFVFDGVVTFTNTGDNSGIGMTDGTTTTTALTPDSVGSTGTTVIDGGRITANTLALSAVEDTSASGARMSFNNEKIEIYDASGNLRITIGKLV